MTDIAPLRAACPCGAPLPPKTPRETIRPKRYCSEACRTEHGRWGRSYGQVAPRELKVYGFRTVR